MSDVAVSVICTSYNYQEFIARALQSFVAQKTNFPFEIIVVDDCSIDKSMDIIRDYESKYPTLFRVFQNPENKGLTRTWIAICKEARGKYIARCDADDYWHDPLKLQKQYDALEASDDSVWSNTDFNIVDENDNILHEHVFVNGPIKNANTYEKMLVTKGMTLPSSWMIETKLMQEVNELIDPTSMDDGYPMQLEFFNRTTLLTLSDATVSYRMTVNSDSRPKNTEKALKRFDSILSNQLESIEKYPEKDFKLITKMLLEKDRDNDIEVYQRDREIERLHQEYAQLRQVSNEQDTYIKDLEKQSARLWSDSQEKDTLLTQKDQELRQVTSELKAVQDEYQIVINSRRWIITTKIIDFFRRNK